MKRAKSLCQLLKAKCSVKPQVELDQEILSVSLASDCPGPVIGRKRICITPDGNRTACLPGGAGRISGTRLQRGPAVDGPGTDGTIWIAIRNDRRTGIMIRRKDEMEPLPSTRCRRGWEM